MKTYEIYYSDNGHCGPFKTIEEAKSYAKQYLHGRKHRASVEIRSSDSKVIGGYNENPDSHYVRSFVTEEDVQARFYGHKTKLVGHPSKVCPKCGTLGKHYCNK